MFLFRPRHHFAAEVETRQGPADPLGRAASHIVEKQGTPTMGGLMMLSGIFRLHAVVGGPAQPIWLGGAVRDARLRALSASTTISSSDELLDAGLFPARAPRRRIRHRRRGGCTASCGSARNPVEFARHSLFKGCSSFPRQFLQSFVGALVIVGAGNSVNIPTASTGSHSCR